MRRVTAEASRPAVGPRESPPAERTPVQNIPFGRDRPRMPPQPECHADRRLRARSSSRGTPALIGVAGAGLIGAAVFATDPVSGYPPGTPDALPSPSRAGTAHNLAAVPVFFGLPAAALASSWRSWRSGRRGFGLYSISTALTMLATTALAAAGFGQSPRLAHLGGLFQRVSIITGFAWLTALSARALQRAPATRSAKP